MTDRIKRLCDRIYIGQLALLAILSAGWWGILYPDLSMTEDVFQPVPEERETRETEEHLLSGREGFFFILDAGPEELEIKSKLIETLLRGKENE